MNRITVTCALPAFLLLLGACSDDNEKKACPTGGLGVTAPSGKKCNSILNPSDPNLLDCQQQVEDYKKYDCKEPQVCFDTNFQSAWGFVISQSASAYSMSFILTNCSSGTEKLVISKVEVLGNSRCYFDFKMNCTADDAGQVGTCDVEKMEIAPGESGLIRARYFPEKSGEDDAILRVHTNAENFPQLDLYICGSGVPLHPVGMDSGPSPDLEVHGDFGVGRFCKNVTTPASCP